MGRLQTNAVCFSLFVATPLFVTSPILAQTTTPSSVSTHANPPSYKIIIDPGHGGDDLEPYDSFGDKYNSLTGKYLEKYKTGTEHKGKKESVLMMELAREVKKILDLTKTPAGFREFEKHAKKFTSAPLKPIHLDAKLSREDNYTERKWEDGADVNADYRLYDYPHKKTGEIQPGRLSKINAEKPYLVLSLHMNPAEKGSPGGMAVVLTPGFSTFQMLADISSGKTPPSKFQKSPWANWLHFIHKGSSLDNAITDAWIYFHGYWPDKDGKGTDLKKFEGYRQNMLQWKYADEKGWEEKAKKGGVGPYAKTHKDFRAEGKFWKREKSQAESWRREEGREGFGGDNHYASRELLRFVQYGLRAQNTSSKKDMIPGPIHSAYISTYSLPTFTNAIVAFLEIGYINREPDIEIITNHKKELAISLAVGVYSLFQGIEVQPKKSYPYTPKGKKINWSRYENYNGKNYFHEVVE